MITVLIVDDEYYVRVGIRNRIDWTALEMEIAGEAENGQQALAMLLSLRPDIVIVDIRMPGMDGLQFIHAARDGGSQARFVILSGYNDFEYARRAIALGVDEYVLKPFELEELRAALGKCAERVRSCHSEKLREEQLQGRIDDSKLMSMEKHVSQLLAGSKIAFANQAAWPCFRVLSIYIRDSIGYGLDMRAWDALLRETFAPLLREGSLVWSRNEECADEIRVVINHQGGTEADLYEGLTGVMKRLNCTRMRAAVSDEFADLRLMAQQYRKTHQALLCKIFLPQMVIFARDIPGSLPVFSEHLSKDLDAVSESLKNRDLEAFQRDLRRLLQRDWRCIEAYQAIIHSICAKATEYSARFHMERDAFFDRLSSRGFLLEIERWEDFEMAVYAPVLRFFSDGSQLDDRSIASAIQVFILNNLQQDLRIPTIARYFFLNPNYVSQLFKKKTGIPISVYVEDQRILRAKALLADERIQVTEVALLAGYPDPAHFSKVFKRKTGYTPSRYQQLYQVKTIR